MAALGLDCYLIDGSVENPPVSNPRFHFTPKFLGLYDAGDYVTLDTYVERSVPGDSDLLLQMDIEGAEWGVLANASPQVLSRFRIIAIEFHFLERLLYSELHRSVLNRLLLSHNVVHMHLNNAGQVRWSGDLGLPEYLEVTFLRKDRAEPLGFVTTLPHELDVRNVDYRAAEILPPCWYSPAAEL